MCQESPPNVVGWDNGGGLLEDVTGCLEDTSWAFFLSLVTCHLTNYIWSKNCGSQGLFSAARGEGARPWLKGIPIAFDADPGKPRT